MGMDDGPQVPGKGDWLYLGGAWTEASVYGFVYNFNVRAGVEAGGGPGGIDIYLQPGQQSVAGVVNNHGTFPESGLTCNAEIYSYVEDPNGTLVYTDTVGGISLAPLTGEQAVSFVKKHTFNDSGIYSLVLSLPLGNDFYPDNNQRYLGIAIDGVAPTTTHALNPAVPNGQNGWYIGPVEVTLTANDGTEDWQSDVDMIQYRIDGGSWQTYTSKVTVSTEGTHTVGYRAIDNAGNQETEKTVSFKIDQVAPNIAMEYTWEKVGLKYNIIVTATCSDVTSGMAKVEFYFNGALQETVTGAGPDYVWTYEYNAMPSVVIKGIAYDAAGLNAFATIENPTSYSIPQSQQSQQSQKVTVLTQPLVR
jgi:hypothetical protein